MARYRSFGGLDDVLVDDLDVGFRGMNLRLPAWQLAEGELSLSQNGRIDGHWYPRLGANVLTVGSLVSGAPLRLPFWLIDASGGAAITAASLSGNVVSLTVTGHGLPVTYEGVSAVLEPSGTNNGIKVVAVDGVESGVVSVEVLTPEDLDATSITLDGDKITVIPMSEGIMSVSGFISPLEIFNGDYAVTGEQNGRRFYTLVDSIYLVTLGYDSTKWRFDEETAGEVVTSFNDEAASPADVTAWIRQSDSLEYGPITIGFSPIRATETIAAMNATGAFSALMTASNADGSDGSGEMAAVAETFLFGSSTGDSAYLGIEGLGFTTTDPNGVQLVTPTNANTLTFPLTGPDETYTAGAGDVVRSVLDDFATEQLLGACVFSDPNSENEEFILLAYGLEVKKVSLADGTIESLGLPGTETIDSDVHMVQAMDKVLLFRPGLVAMQWVAGDTDFTLVPYGTYTQPQILETSAAAVASGSATFTVTGNTTIEVGDWVTIYSSTDARFEPFVGQQFECTSITSTTTIVLQMPVANSGSSASTTQIGKRVSVGGGFIHQPGFPWAIYFQRRIWGPYQYFWDTSLTPDAFSDRGVRDELIAGDILDSDTFDAISNQFRITGGIADYLVGLHPFFDDTLLCFMRNSVHAISGTIGSLLDASTKELTREIGCMARRSIVTQGNSVFFLSDNGVYGLEFQDQYNLRGTERPLSEAIQPLIDRISRDLAGNAVGAYHDNRYWLAVPLDTLPRQGDARGNNAILVYNLLNRAWESVDTFGDPEFFITDLLIGTAGARNDLYAVTKAGGIHILNSIDRAVDQIASNPTSGVQNFDINASFTTRGYLGNTLDRKRFAEMGIQMQSGNDFSDVGMTFQSSDPDNAADEVLASATMGEYLDAGNSADVRARVGGVRGFYGTVTVRRLIGRPFVSGVKVSGTATNRATISQK